ncbi:GNAT family N-acetyltransferase [Mucilaginibacter sp. OK283]|jgi:GNAT superfamily N-acetyltransferase|uniref:GNAT family N-acetyltransferase n=1 Tax=Mucilaginibacter sp. OK283 TaxID=1881049 RepID=UPI0008BD941E|nr:GNAT family N-acetyltransferase [Mucilaginibacter sp. OK283]SEO51701.1 Acetyltransferase (GNAT) family protein [Mucilaginibacter sp. OK283]
MSVKIELLNSALNKKDFSCGKQMLDNYLHKQAGQDVKRKLCVVFAMFEDTTIKGYYTLSNASIPAELMPEAVRKKMPGAYKTLPVTLLGRLAIDVKFKGQGLGSIILLDALKRSFDIANKSLGSIGVVVDPLDNDALAFYKKFGFILLPDSGKMFLPMADIAQLGL